MALQINGAGAAHVSRESALLDEAREHILRKQRRKRLDMTDVVAPGLVAEERIVMSASMRRRRSLRGLSASMAPG